MAQRATPPSSSTSPASAGAPPSAAAAPSSEAAAATDRCDVAIVGAGLAGRLAAARLRDHAHVLLIDAPGPPAAASSRSLGIVAAGGMDSPARLALALGEEGARQAWEFSSAAVAELPGVRRTGSLRIAFDEQERAEWARSAELLERWTGTRPDALDGAAVEAAGYGSGFAGAVRIAGDGIVDVGALLADLPGPDVVAAARVCAPSSGGVTLDLGEQAPPLTAELVIVAAGASSGAVHPWFSPMVFPVRLQALRTDPLERRWTAPALVRHRFENWLQEDDGRLAFTGCRWAEQPEMEAGVTDDTTTSEKVHARQVEFLTRHLGVDVSGATSWTGIAAFGCDGLPLIGPLPGNPRILALTGWGGWGLSFAARAVADVCDAVLGRDEARTTPAFLGPRRMA